MNKVNVIFLMLMFTGCATEVSFNKQPQVNNVDNLPKPNLIFERTLNGLE